MAHPRYPHSDEPGAGTGGQPRRSQASGTPLWVMVARISVAVALVLLMVVLHVTGVLGPGEHR
jgi:hypothetical protein